MNKKTIYPLITTAALVLMTAIYLLLGPGGGGLTSGRQLAKVGSGVHMVMGTFAGVVVMTEDIPTGNKCIDAALDAIHDVDNLMSDYKPDSEISRANRNAFASPVKLSPDTFEVIQKSIEMSRLTDGAFDITVGPLVELFRTSQKTGKAPTPEEIADAKAKTGYEKLLLDEAGKTVRFTVEGMRLDLGGIAKGYAVDKAIEVVKENGALGAMVDIGGDIRCFGTPPHGKKSWVIALQDPNSEDPNGAGYLLKLKISDSAVTTSGDYRQYALIDGQRHSHILDRTTGTSARGLASVTIIAKDATTADALATAATVLGPEKGLDLIENTPKTEAFLISPAPEYKLTKTAAAEKYIKE